MSKLGEYAIEHYEVFLDSVQAEDGIVCCAEIRDPFELKGYGWSYMDALEVLQDNLIEYLFLKD